MWKTPNVEKFENRRGLEWL